MNPLPASLPGEYRAFVAGPVPTMGSKRIGRIAGKPVILNCADTELRTWQEKCRLALRQEAPAEPYSGLVWVTLIIVLERPAAHYYTGRRAHELRGTAPKGFATSRRDTDKQARALGDCLTGEWVKDDRQIAAWTILRVWPGYVLAEQLWFGPLKAPGAYIHCVETKP